MTTYIHPDNPFFGGMEQVILAFMIIYLIGVIVFLFVVALIIKYVLIAIFGKYDEERIDNDIVKTEEASEQEVVENSAQSSDDAKDSGQNQV